MTSPVLISRKPKGVVFRFSNGSATRASLDAIAKSTVLSAVVELAQDDESVVVNFFEGLLEAWTFWHKLPDTPAARLAVPAPTLLECLKAADFLGDEESLSAICSLVCQWAFAETKPDDGMCAGGTKHRVTQMLEYVPEAVLPRVLQESSLPMERIFESLPSECSAAALYAAHPGIAQTGELELARPKYEMTDYNDVKNLWEAIFRYSNLVRLSLAGNCQMLRVISSFTAGISALTRLQVLNLEAALLGPVISSELLSSLGKLSSLGELNLRGNGLGCEGVRALSPELRSLKNLKVLNLADNGIGDDGAKVLARSLGDLHQLQILDLGGNAINLKGYRLLGRQFPFLGTLQQLRLDGVALGGQGAKSLAHRLPHLTNLRVLSLYGCGIEAQGVMALSHQMRNLRALEHLNLGSNRMFDHEAATALSSALRQASKLQSLQLEGTGLNAHGIEALGASFTGLRSLRVLNLSKNWFGDSGVQNLALHFSSLSSLEGLDLSRNSVFNRGLLEIAQQIGALKKLRSLNLRLNSITSSGAMELIPHVKELKNIQDINLEYNCVTCKDASGWPSVVKVTLDLFVPPEDMF